MRFDKNAGWDLFNLDCNERLKQKEIKSNQNTTNKAIFINEFWSGIMKTTCSSGSQSRGDCDIYLSVVSLYYNDYKKDWGTYGNIYAEYCPISLSEREILGSDIKLVI